MADTITVELNPNGWTLVSSTGGFASNGSKQKIIYRESSSTPAGSVVTGHLLSIAPDDFFQFTLVSGQNIYARSVGQNATLVVTPGDS